MFMNATSGLPRPPFNLSGIKLMFLLELISHCSLRLRCHGYRSVPLYLFSMPEIIPMFNKFIRKPIRELTEKSALSNILGVYECFLWTPPGPL
jgi:hypothetical protein